MSKLTPLTGTREGRVQVAGQLQVGRKISQVGGCRSQIYQGDRVLIWGAGSEFYANKPKDRHARVANS